MKIQEKLDKLEKENAKLRYDNRKYLNYITSVAMTQCWRVDKISCDVDDKLCIICEGRKLAKIYKFEESEDKDESKN